MRWLISAGTRWSDELHAALTTEADGTATRLEQLETRSADFEDRLTRLEEAPPIVARP